MIRFESVSKSYPDGTVAVDELDLGHPPGRSPCSSGPSGCGKTTSLRMINRMIEPTSGTHLARRHGHREHAGRTSCAGGIGYVIQHAGLFPHRTVVDNIATVPLLLGQGKREARAAGDGAARAGRPGPPTFAKRYPAQLSGGQQQRVGVARALAADPPVMLMDEPFCAVDPVVRAQLQDEFLRLQGELGKTIVFVTHDIDEAVKLGDQVAVLRGRRHSWPSWRHPAELLARPGRRLRRGVRRPRPRLPGAGASTPAGALPTRDEPTVALGDRCRRGRDRTAGSWSSTTERQPQGWLDLRPTPAGTVGRRRTCCTAAARWPPRAARCARRSTPALSSPSGRGVVVDDDGPADRHGHRARGRSTLIERPGGGRTSPGLAVAAGTRVRHVTSALLHSTTTTDPRLAVAPHLARRRSRRARACCSRCRSAGSRIATAGSTRRW